MFEVLGARFSWYATYMSDTELFTKLIEGDLIPLEEKYQKHCPLMYRNHVRLECKNNPTVSQFIQK